MSAELSCPYCNARFTAPDVRDVQGRRLCPRCGEPLPGRSGDTTVQLQARPLLATPPKEEPTALPSRRWLMRVAVLWGIMLLLGLHLLLFPAVSRAFKPLTVAFTLGAIGGVASIWLWFFRLPRSNQATSRFVLLNMALMVCVGVSYALWTVSERRLNDPRDTPTKPVPPAELVALGYLPDDVTLIAGVHVRELLEEPAGKAFLEQPGWGPIQFALKNVEKWTGLKTESIDHVGLGVREGADLPLFKQLLFPKESGGLPRSLAVVVRTRRPYNPETPPDALKKLPASSLHGKPLYRFQPMGLQALLGEGLVWCASEKTLVLVLWWDGNSVDDVTKTLPATPRVGVAGLAKPLRDAVNGRLRVGTPLWLAGHETSHHVLAALLPFPRALTDAGDDLKQIRTFALGLRLDKSEATLQGDVLCRNEKSARALKGYFEKQNVTGIGAPRVVSTVPEAHDWVFLWTGAVATGDQPLHLATTVSAVTLQEHWVTFQLRSNSETVLATLRRPGGPLSFVP